MIVDDNNDKLAEFWRQINSKTFHRLSLLSCNLTL